ncbi:MAG: hypothetical protein JO166_02540 [Deltaproteobacteria bacterium]|nr:hypothetical protein [Deltaproteobacteria bacterium]
MDNQLPFGLANLHSDPFNPAATPDYPYLSASFQELLAAIYYGLEYGNRILIVSAERGLGKTTLLRYLERRLRDRSRTLLVSPGCQNGREILHKMLSEIGGAATSDDLLLLRDQLDATFERIATADHPFILLLDYDEDNTGSTLDVLCLLATLESMEKELLRVVVAICPAVAEALRGSGLADEVLTLSGLAASEVKNYIDHRLRIGGWNGAPLFTARACALIAAKSTGTASSINEICRKLLRNLPQLDGARATGSIEEGIVDDFCVESLIPGQNLNDSTAGVIHLDYWASRSLKHWATVMATIVVMLGIAAVAVFWYRSGSKQHSGTHIAAATADRSSSRLQAAAFSDGAHRQLATASAALIKPNVGGSTSAPKPPPAPPARLQAPATAVASRMQAKSASAEMVRTDIAGSVHPLLSSSTGQVTMEKPGQHPVSDNGKSAQKPITVEPSAISLSSASSTSSSAAMQTTLRSTPATSVRARDVQKGDSGASQEMAAYNIRLGDAYMEVGDYEKARSSFARAVGWAPESKEALDKMRRAERAKAAEDNVLRQ